MSVDADIRLRPLLAQAGWIRALARELVRDPDLVDEIEQRALLAGMTSGPREGVPLRSWLGRVVRNLARQARRAAARRARHEERAARDEAQPSAAELVERAAVQRALVDAVLALREPYRSTILLRFYEGLPPRAVARRLGVPVATVRTRTARAIAELRARLDAGHGGERAAWLGALVPLLAPGALLPDIPTTILMNTKLKLTAAALVAAGLATFFWTRSPAPSAADSGAETIAERARRGASSTADPAATEGRSAPQREPRSNVAPRSASAAAPSAAPVRASRGKVVDAHGRALAGIHVGFEAKQAPDVEDTRAPSDRALAVSDADGAFSISAAALATAPDGPRRLVALDEEWTTVLAASLRPPSGAAAEPVSAVLVVARPRALAATVVDELGAPVEEARVGIGLDEAFRSRLREILDASTALERDARTDAHGRVEFAELPDLADVHVEVRAERFLPWRARLVDLAPATVITLVAPRAGEGAVRGKIVDPAGTPVPGARVAFGVDTTRADERGEFAFALDDERSLGKRFGVEPDALCALERGYQPAWFRPPVADGKPAWPAYVTLQLGAPTLELRGRVLDPEGEPLAGARVWIMDATFFGGDDRGPLHVESLLGSGAERGWRRMETGADGAFAIDGLLEREYHVEALDPSTLLRVQAGPFRPAAGGATIELRLPRDALHPRVRGRVVSRKGLAVAGARVFPMCDAFRTRVRGKIVSTAHQALDGVTTDADGRFELVDVPKELVYVRVEGESILPLEYCRVGDGDDRFASERISRLPAERVTELVIEVALRCHLQVELADPASADALALVDARGAELELNVYDGPSRRTAMRFPIVEGRSAALAVSEDARAVVLYRAGAEIARVPVDFAAGTLNAVRF